MICTKSTLDIQTDNAGEEWLPKIYVPVGCVINNNIGGDYKVKGKSANMVKRFIGQYWTVETHPWVDTTRIIPHKPLPTLTAHVHTVVFGQNYMRDGNYIHAKINQLKQVDKIKSKEYKGGKQFNDGNTQHNINAEPKCHQEPECRQEPKWHEEPECRQEPKCHQESPTGTRKHGRRTTTGIG